MPDTFGFMRKVQEQSVAAFKGQKRLLTYQQYLDAFCAHPERLGRNAAEYVLDMFKHYGSRKVDTPAGKVTRFNVFDAPWENGRDSLQGHETVQLEIARHLRRFAVTGRADKLVLLHGPNGSGKSSVLSLIVRAMENYSTLEDGALFRFNWIFTDKNEGKGLGFAPAPAKLADSKMGFGPGINMAPQTTAKDDASKTESLALLDDALISCKIGSDLRESPFFLIPPEHRIKLLDQLVAERPTDTALAERAKSTYLREGTLSSRNKHIFDALMNAYKGEWQKVMRHVQVERYFISKMYRTGASAIEPQQAVDAGTKPIAYDSGLPLPPVLQGLPLLELHGELAEASGGVLEFSDFLKRNLEMNKYLLGAVEHGSVSLPGTMMKLNMVMLGACNEKQLSAFKLTPDFVSYKGRIELVRVPYLLEWRKEAAIYRPFIEEIRETRHVAPHTGDVAALWAVLTRLRKPDPALYPSELATVIKSLSPLDKARLYDSGTPPDTLTGSEKRALRAQINALHDEHISSTLEFEGFECAAYEGRRGASTREMCSILASAASLPDRDYLSPLAVLDALEQLLEQPTLYDFLRIPPDGGYHDCEEYIRAVRAEYFNWVSAEVFDSMGLVEEAEYNRRVEEYFRHVRAFVSGEKVVNPRTGQPEDPSLAVMDGLERIYGLKESADSFRRNLISRAAAYSIEHPGTKLDYQEIFSDIFKRLRENIYAGKAKALQTLAPLVLTLGTQDENSIPAAEKPKAETALRNMREKHGYINESAREAIAFVYRQLTGGGT